jgi:hypothetical protein
VSAAAIDLGACRCQEALGENPVTHELVECGEPGAKVVFHQHDGRNVYVMCLPHADHNLRNRGGVELIEISRDRRGS